LLHSINEAYWILINSFNNLRLFDSATNYNIMWMQGNNNEKINIDSICKNHLKILIPNKFIALQLLGNSLLIKYMKKDSKNDLEDAIKAFYLADSLMFTKTNFDEENTAIRFQMDVGRDLCQNGLNAIYESYKNKKDTTLLNLALLFIERMKSSVLFRDINLQANDESIRALKSTYDKLLGEREVSIKNSFNLSDNLAQISRSLDKKLKETNKSDIKNIPNIKEILKSTDKKQTVALYFYGKPSFVLYINHQNILFEKIASDSLTKNIEKYRSCLSSSNPNNSQEEEFKTCSYFLYQQLIKPFEKVLKDQNELIIIPDAELHNIPFESFIIHKNWKKYITAPYLIKHTKLIFSYAPSWKIYNNSLKTLPQYNYKTLCFSYGENKSDLVCSENEINTIINNLGKEKVFNFSKNNCNKEKFLIECQKKNVYNILHLSLHAQGSITNIFDNKIWFSPNRKDFLYGFELSGKISNFQLVVLSACETGLGNTSAGEGAYSLARSFFQSGSKTVIATLWEVEDCQNAIIMQTFYKQLKNEVTPKQALCEAKRLFLSDNTKESILNHPAYWAGEICLE
jgi:CHAT domain-containing protein